MESTHETTISPKDQARLNKADGQWKRLMKDYEDISKEERYVLWTRPFVEFDIADRTNKIRAICVGCNAKYSAESANLKKNHQNCAQSKLNYDAYVASRRVIDESNLLESNGDLQTQDELDLLKMEIAQLKEEAQRKDDKITDLENQLKQARALISNQIDPYHLYDHRTKQPGIARIFQMNFKDKQDFMEMSLRDNQYFKKTLDKFGFHTDIKMCDDSSELLKDLEALTATGLPDYQSLIIIINSHGNYEDICGLDMQLIKNTMISCKGMKEQPKVLITGSCQLYKSKYPAVTNATELTTPYRSAADFLDIRSCSPGEGATFTEENIECANDFFRYFCKSLEKFHMLGISRVVQEAHQKLMEYNEFVKGRSCRQAPEIRSTLRAELFLKSV